MQGESLGARQVSAADFASGRDVPLPSCSKQLDVSLAHAVNPLVMRDRNESTEVSPVEVRDGLTFLIAVKVLS